MRSSPFPVLLGRVPGPLCAPVARALARKARGRAANDNLPDVAAMLGGRARSAGLAGGLKDDRILRAALHHFAEHGLGAAKAARAQADAAFLAGDREGYEWWLGITRTLDRRLAAQAHRPASALIAAQMAAREAGEPGST